MEEKNKKRVVSLIALILIVVLIVSATYAYFAAQVGDGTFTDVNITTATVDNLTFETGNVISINATQTNFASGLNSLSDDTYAKATLVANNDTNSASANYYVYLNISTNEFEYTTSDSTAELILSITMDGTEVTSLDGYDYVSVTDGNSNVISGFDITTATGLITIADNYLIESTGTEVDDWEVTITFVNLDSDQSQNAGASFSASLIIQSKEYITLADYIINTALTDENLYYHSSDLSKDTTGTVVYEVESYKCVYNGQEIESYSGNEIAESDCSTIYKVTDTDYQQYYSGELISSTFYNGYETLSWNDTSNACVIENLNSTYYISTWWGDTPTEEQCTGVAYQYKNTNYYVSGIEMDGIGLYEENEIAYSTSGAEDDSYRYSGGDYELTTTATNAGYANIIGATSTDENVLIQFYCDNEISFVGATCNSEYTYYYTLAYDKNETQYETYQDVLNQAVSDGYLISDNINNYICFGSDKETCPDENLYRIIGVFKNDNGVYEVKLISNTSLTDVYLGKDGEYYDTYSTRYYSGSRNISTAITQTWYYWNNINFSKAFTENGGYYNDWSYSQLNTVNLNTNFLNSLDNKWQDMISYHTWIVGGYMTSYLNRKDAKSAYNYEIINYVSSQVNSTYNSKIGLVYVSDYYYSANSSYWTYVGYSQDYSESYASAKDANWLYIGIPEWTITRSSNYTSSVMVLGGAGHIADFGVSESQANVRPTFYLNSDVQYSSGSGTIDDPIRLSMN